MPPDYPVQFAVEYPDRTLNRLTSAFRIFTAIPILILVAALAGGRGVPVLFLPVLLMLLFRQKYPNWWYDWNLQLVRFTSRVVVYVALMEDRYPSTDKPQSVRVELPYPGAPANVNRWLPLVKWILAFPHYIVLVFLYLAALVVTVVAWFAILFTGRYPRGMFEFVEGVLRWHVRVAGYAFLLVTDQYPPFRLSP